jgi:hypothetical protein
MSAKTCSPPRPRCSAAMRTAGYCGGQPASNFFSEIACNHHIWGYTDPLSTKCGQRLAADGCLEL